MTVDVAVLGDDALAALKRAVRAEAAERRRRKAAQRAANSAARAARPRRPRLVESTNAPPRSACPEQRPCPRAASCRYSLPSGDCALDHAEAGPQSLLQIGALFGLTRERIRQLEAQALRKLARKMSELAP